MRIFTSTSDIPFDLSKYTGEDIFPFLSSRISPPFILNDETIKAFYRLRSTWPDMCKYVYQRFANMFNFRTDDIGKVRKVIAYDAFYGLPLNMDIYESEVLGQNNFIIQALSCMYPQLFDAWGAFYSFISTGSCFFPYAKEIPHFVNFKFKTKTLDFLVKRKNAVDALLSGNILSFTPIIVSEQVDFDRFKPVSSFTPPWYYLVIPSVMVLLRSKKVKRVHFAANMSLNSSFFVFGEGAPVKYICMGHRPMVGIYTEKTDMSLDDAKKLFYDKVKNAQKTIKEELRDVKATQPSRRKVKRQASRILCADDHIPLI